MPPSHQPSTSLPSIHELLPDHVFRDIARRSEPHSFPPPGYPQLSPSMSPSLSPRMPQRGIAGEDRGRFSSFVPPTDTARNGPPYSFPPPPAPSDTLHAQSSYSQRSPAYSRGPPVGENRPAGYSPRLARHTQSLSASDSRYYDSAHSSTDSARSRAHSSPIPRAHPSMGSPYSSNSPLSPSDSLSESDELDEDDDPPTSVALHPARPGDIADDGRRHQCPHCRRRFNRPSSLGIHINTHTGARPFVCQFPGCGKAFNVNSNMRRHYRKHLSAADVPGQQLPTYTSPAGPSRSQANLQFIRYQENDSEYATRHVRDRCEPRTGLDVKDGRARSFTWEAGMTAAGRARS